MKEWRNYFDDRDIFPHCVSGIEFIETHISLICLTGDFVYKIKKPVKFGKILDYSSLGKRQFYCKEEIRLNSRFSPSIYRGVVCLRPGHITEKLDDQFEYAVKMVQLPQDNILENLLTMGRYPSDEVIDCLISQLTSFYKSTETRWDFAYWKSLNNKIQENFESLHDLNGLNPSYQETVLDFLYTNESLFKRRIKSGRIKDGHGDLQPKNIFITANEEVKIFDCIEFNESLRVVDICEDIAFLAMELDRYGLQHQSTYLMEEFSSSMQDDELYLLLNFFKSYRAAVKQKVNLFRITELDSSDTEEREVLVNLAKDYEELALKYMEE